MPGERRNILGLVGSIIILLDALRDDAPPPAAGEVRRHLVRRRARHLMVASFPRLLVRERGPRLEVPTNLLFFVASLVLLILTLQHSYELGRLEEQTRTLAEEVALLRLALDEQQATGAAPRPTADPGRHDRATAAVTAPPGPARRLHPLLGRPGPALRHRRQRPGPDRPRWQDHRRRRLLSRPSVADALRRRDRPPHPLPPQRGQPRHHRQLRPVPRAGDRPS